MTGVQTCALPISRNIVKEVIPWLNHHLHPDYRFVKALVQTVQGTEPHMNRFSHMIEFMYSGTQKFSCRYIDTWLHNIPARTLTYYWDQNTRQVFLPNEELKPPASAVPIFLADLYTHTAQTWTKVRFDIFGRGAVWEWYVQENQRWFFSPCKLHFFYFLEKYGVWEYLEQVNSDQCVTSELCTP